MIRFLISVRSTDDSRLTWCKEMCKRVESYTGGYVLVASWLNKTGPNVIFKSHMQSHISEFT